MIIGAAVLIAVILVVGKAAGLIGDSKDSSLDQQNQQAQVTQAADEDDGMVPVPILSVRQRLRHRNFALL